MNPDILLRLVELLGYGITLAGLRLLIHRTGFLSLGEGAFAAIGAYTTAILSTLIGIPAALTVPLAGGLAFIAGTFISLPALAFSANQQVSAIYLLLASLGLTLATPYILQLPGLIDWTGGAGGLVLDTHPSVGLALTCVLAIPLIVATQMPIATRSPRPLMLSHDPQAAVPIANGAFALPLLFGLSAGFAACAGSLLVLTLGFISPELFFPVPSLVLLLGLLLVGTGSVWGLVVGALLTAFVAPLIGSVFARFGEDAELFLTVLYGAAIVACVVFMPRGLMGLWQRRETPS